MRSLISGYFMDAVQRGSADRVRQASVRLPSPASWTAADGPSSGAAGERDAEECARICAARRSMRCSADGGEVQRGADTHSKGILRRGVVGSSEAAAAADGWQRRRPPGSSALGGSAAVRAAGRQLKARACDSPRADSLSKAAAYVSGSPPSVRQLHVMRKRGSSDFLVREASGETAPESTSSRRSDCASSTIPTSRFSSL